MHDIGESFEYRDDSTTFEGYVVRPFADTTDRATVVLTHDWSGINDGMRTVARRIAAMGYVAAAIDVYGKGVRGDQLGDNHHLMNPLLTDRSLLQQRLCAGLSAVAELRGVDRSRLAVVGPCFGGLCALDLARAAPPGLRAAISVHGVLAPTGLVDARPIAASVLVLHGWEDPLAPSDAVLALARELTDAGADWQLHAYGHAMHAFTFEGLHAPERGLAYHADASRRAWASIASFLAERIGPDA
jgi:dienelactone hydrolase